MIKEYLSQVAKSPALQTRRKEGIDPFASPYYHIKQKGNVFEESWQQSQNVYSWTNTKTMIVY